MGRPSSRRRWWIGPLLLGAAIGLAAAGTGVLLVDRSPPQAVAGAEGFGRGADLAWASGERPAPTFTLPDQRGEVVSLAAFGGDVPVLVAFLNSFCTDICPIQGRQLADLADRLPTGRRPTILVVSVNPDDTPASVRRAARSWGWQDLEWHWLMGAKEELTPIWRAYGIQARPGEGDGQVQHTGALYLIDGAGDVRSAYTVPVPMPRLVADIETLENA